MSLVGKTIKFDTDSGVFVGTVIDKVIGYAIHDKSSSTRYLVETTQGDMLSIVPYQRVLSIIREPERVIPREPQTNKVNLNNKLPGSIPKVSWPKVSEYPQSDL